MCFRLTVQGSTNRRAPDPEDLSEDWIKLARRNVNEVPELREERIARCSVL